VTNAKRVVRGAWLALLVLCAACGQPGQAEQESKTMKASTTYLYLLRNTPFFTGLDTEQLRWTINHSREWEAEADTVVTQNPDSSGDVWVLLDGAWQLEYDGHHYPSRHADPGKWFSAKLADEAQGGWRLVATEHSYVMKISRAEFDAMLQRGFAFEVHLDEGYRYYVAIFRPESRIASPMHELSTH
jgi:hypothetical protein